MESILSKPEYSNAINIVQYVYTGFSFVRFRKNSMEKKLNIFNKLNIFAKLRCKNGQNWNLGIF